MKLVSQRFRDGLVQVMDVPVPTARDGMVLVRTAASAISSGTEGMKVTLGRKSLLEKARQRPDQVALVLNTLKEQGPAATLRRVRSRLDFPEALGYSSCGVVIAAPAHGATDLPVGTRVACAGPGAYHAEVALVARTFCVPVPDAVATEDGAFTGLGAIATEAVHQSHIVVGETVGVIGLGLIGQLIVQIAKASGARVVAIDIDPTRVQKAVDAGADLGLVRSSPGTEARVSDITQGRGLDAVLVTAATRSNDPLVLAGRLATENGRVVLVGAVDIELPRKEYYEKQLRFQVSRSFGAGSYDVAYQRGQDYSTGLTRWTARTNMETFVNLLANGSVRMGPLITHRWPIDEAAQAYELIVDGGTAGLGMIITYPNAPHEPAQAPPVVEPSPRRLPATRQMGVGFIGAGSFAQAYLLPAVKGRPDTRLTTVVTGSSASASTVRARYGFARAGSAPSDVLDDPDTDCVFIATRHELHAALTADALRRGKHVFVEKPIARDREELAELTKTVKALMSNGACPLVGAGYNRRFAPLAVAARKQIAQIRSPLLMHYRINAGAVPAGSWVREPGQGGRIVGEACHFVDFLTFLCDSVPVQVYAEALPSSGAFSHENIQALIRFADGSVGNVEYAAVGDRALPRERVEVIGGQIALVIDNFRRLDISSGGRTKHSGRWATDLGQAQGVNAFLDAVKAGGQAPIPFDQIRTGMLATILIEESIAAGTPLPVVDDP